ncbi:hypothetical protein JXJ21_07785 [candidate division KSB1 bacterium]|nr:hypothetical protein [candidate division KSB1 bacterium]
MPELPELEVIKNFLNQNVIGVKIEDVKVRQPLVIRCLLNDFTASLCDNSFRQVERRGKFLLLHLEKDVSLVINLMLSGRLQYIREKSHLNPKTCFQLILSNQTELRYFDMKFMGRIYLAKNNDFSHIPQFEELGMDPLSGEFTLERFREGLKNRWGMIKNVITNQRFISGIGNAYSDEILFMAGISPLRKSTTLLPQEIERLHTAIRKVLSDSIDIISKQTGENIHKQNRDFFQVHGRGSMNCAICAYPITELKPDGKITNYCRVCQK